MLPPAAMAQGTDEEEDAPPPAATADDPLPVASPRLTPWRDGHVWRNLGFRLPAVALARTPEGGLLVMARDGAIYRESGRALWEQVLSGRLTLDGDVDEEELLLDAESAVEDFSDTSSDDGLGSSSTSEDSSDDSATTTLPDDGLTDAVDIGILDADDRFSGALAAPRALWASAATPGLVLASRGDGGWRSTDGGRTWDAVDGLPPARDFLEIPARELLLAATGTGLWVSDDQGETWQEGDPTLRGVSVYDLDSNGPLLYAASAEGLWQSIDGRRWGKLLPPSYADQAMEALAVDRGWTGGLWVASGESGLLRSDDAGQSFRPAGRNPLLGTRTIVPLADASGHVLAAGVDGVWESTDGGVRWVPLAEGLPGPQVLALLPGELPVIATPTGLYALRRPVQIDVERGGGGAAVGLSAAEALDIALRRTGLDMDALRVQRQFVRSLLSPRLRLSAEHQDDAALKADYDGIRTTRDDDYDWTFRVDLCFGACGTSSSYTTADDYDLGFLDSVELAVIDGEVYATDDTVSAVAPAAANVSQRLSRYRGDVADYVNALYYSRQRLLTEQTQVTTLPLIDQVYHALEIQEVVARLDVYTDGSYSSSLQNP